MASNQMVRMNQGQGEASYARNSSIQVSSHFLFHPLILFLLLVSFYDLLICFLTLAFHQELVHNMAYITEI
jgi:hypothetical protein